MKPISLLQPANGHEVPLFISLSNWSIFLIKDVYSKKASSPTKQGEIMAMGIPLICNDIGDTGPIMVNSKAGVLLKALSNEGYQEAVDQMFAVEPFASCKDPPGSCPVFRPG